MAGRIFVLYGTTRAQGVLGGVDRPADEVNDVLELTKTAWGEASAYRVAPASRRIVAISS